MPINTEVISTLFLAKIIFNCAQIPDIWLYTVEVIEPNEGNDDDEDDYEDEDDE